jgi:RNA polymerase sigma-70 factor (ECF subfamily)
MGKRQEPLEQRFERIYRETNQDVLAYLMRRSETMEDAADALAETYAAAWRKIDALPEGDRVRLWLFGAARNELRKTASRRRAGDDLVSALARNLRTSLEDPFEGHEHRDSMRDALAVLSRLDCEIVTLTAWEELTPREIAAVLGLSANAVRIRLHKARGKLRALLQRDQDLEMTPYPTTQYSGGINR